MKKHTQNVHGSATSMERVDVCGTPIDACRDGDTIWISVRRVCDALGLAPHKQIERLRRKAWATGTVMVAVADDGKAREVYCLSHKSLPMWLATIEPSRSTSPRLAEFLARFQKEAADVLYRHFFRVQAPTVDLASLRDSLRADLSAEFAPVLSRLAALESQGAIVLGNTGPSIGDATADIYVRHPVQEIARTLAKAVKNDTPAAVKSLRFKTERDLRAAVDFPMTKGMGWHAFPTARLGELGIHLNRMLTTARGLAQVSIPKPVQLSLVANGNGAKKSG